MIRQSPRILKAISAEHKWLRDVISDYQPDAVISDNRYGLYHPKIKSIFITHQLQIKSSAGKWGDKLLQKRNYKFINRFTECWVPDVAGNDNLSGELSHPLKMPAVPVKYIGPLSRFSKKEIGEKKGHLLLLLSGPEPQRSKLEEILIHEILHYNETATVVRGLPGNKTFIPSTGMLQFYNHLPADELNREMQKAEFIISRSGYSTVMDAMALHKKCIFIPTPGQTEQEYIGKYLMSKRIALCVPQKNFSLTSVLEAARNFQFNIPVVVNDSLLSEAVTGLMSQLPVTDFG
jgi:UDP-N-acetylglucosamine transferase subunit ALG13